MAKRDQLPFSASTLYKLIQEKECVSEYLSALLVDYPLTYKSGLDTSVHRSSYLRYLDDEKWDEVSPDANDEHIKRFLMRFEIPKAERVETIQIIKSINMFTRLLSDKSDKGETFLHLALRLDKWAIADQLADVIHKLLPKQRRQLICNSQDNDGRNIAHLACLSQKLKNKDTRNELNNIFALILGCDLSAKDSKGEIPLHVACSAGSGTMVQQLLVGMKETTWNASNAHGDTPLHLVVRNARMRIDDFCSFLRGYGDVNRRNMDGNTPLHLAALLSDNRYVEALLTYGAQKSARIRNLAFEFPLHCACKAPTPSRRNIKLLLEAYPDSVASQVKHPLDNSTHGDTALHLVCSKNGTHEAVEELFQHEVKPDANAKDLHDARPVYYLFKKGEVDFQSLLILLKHGTDIDGSNSIVDRRSSVIEVVFDKKLICAIDVIICYLIDPQVEGKRWSSQVGSLLPSPYELKLVEQFVRALLTLQLITKRLAASKDLTPPNDEIWTAAMLSSKVGCADFLERCLANDKVTEVWFKGDAKILKRLLEVSISYGHGCILSRFIEMLPTDIWLTSLEALAGEGIALLIEKFPNLASKSFDRCLQKNQQGIIELQFRLLDETPVNETPVQTVSGSGDTPFARTRESLVNVAGQNLLESTKPSQPSRNPNHLQYWESSNDHPILLMIRSDQRRKENEAKLIDHPLVRIFILRKWCPYGMMLSLQLSFVYITFLSYLTFLFFVQALPRWDDRNSTTQVPNATAVVDLASVASSYGVIAVALIIVMGIALIKEILEMYLKGKRYFSWENLLEFLMYIAALVLAILYYTDNAQRTYAVACWQWRISGFAMFLGWINLTLFFRKTPLGITVIAFEKIFLTFLKHLPLIIIYAFAFAVLFRGFLHSSLFFRNFRPLLKVAVLTVGDYPTFDHIMAIDGIENTSPNDLDSYLGAAIFLLFLCVMTIVMMNMLVGIAVDEISKVLKDSELTSMAMKAEWITEVWKLKQKGFLRRLLIFRFTKFLGFPNRESLIYQLVDRPSNSFLTRWMYEDLVQAIERAKAIWESTHTTLPQDPVMSTLQSEVSTTRELLSSVSRDFDSFKSTVGEKLQQQQLLQERQNSLLQQILERLPKP